MTTFKNLIRFMLLAFVSTSVAVGCGPGKHKRRQPIKSSKTLIDPKTGQPIAANKQTPEQAKKAAEDLKNKSGIISNIEGQVKQLKSGTNLDKSTMDEGTYTLDGVTSYFSLINTKTSDDVRVYRTHGVQNGNLTDTAAVQATGFLANSPDVARTIEVPALIKVDRSSSPDFTLIPDAFSKNLLVRTEAIMNQKEFKMDLRDTTQALASLEQAPRASVSQMLMGSAQATKEGKLALVDENNREVVLSIVKTSDTRVNIVVEIVESKEPMVVRNLIMSYALQKAAKQQQTVQNQQQPQQQQQQQAPVQTNDGQQVQTNEPPLNAIPGADDDQGMPR